jgi:hypothetical protein
MNNVKKNPLNWEEIESVFLKKLQKTKTFLTFGTVGSHSLEHDIDIVITKKKNVSSSGFYKEVHKFLDALDKYVQKTHKVKAIRFHDLREEGYLRAFGILEKNDLGIHLMLYQSLAQWKLNWAGAQGVNVEKMIRNDYCCLLGSPKLLFSEQFKKESKYDAAYNLAYHADRSNSHLATKQLVILANVPFSYIHKNILNKSYKPVKNKNEVRERLYEICDILDELERK